MAGRLFVCWLSCVAGSTFYYDPEYDILTLLEQRRRWINGTWNTFYYLCFSREGQKMLMEGSLPATTRIFKLLWLLQVRDTREVISQAGRQVDVGYSRHGCYRHRHGGGCLADDYAATAAPRSVPRYAQAAQSVTQSILPSFLLGWLSSQEGGCLR